MAVLTTDMEADARRLSDTERTRFCTTADFLSWLNDATQDLYDLVDSQKQPHFTDHADFQITSGNEMASFPATFHRELGLTRDYGTASAKTIFPLDSFQDRNTCGELRYWLAGSTLSLWPPSAAPGNYRLDFVPRPPVFADGATVPAELARYKEYLTVFMAIKALTKRKQPTEVLERRLAKAESRITTATSNRRAEPRKIPLPRNEKRVNNRWWPDGTL